MNGWQRHWVVISVPWWIVWVGLFVVLQTPNTTEFYLLVAAIMSAPVVLYIIGLATRWVIEGFRNGRNDEAG